MPFFEPWLVAIGFMHDLAPHLLVAPIEMAMNASNKQALLNRVAGFIDNFPTDKN
jgi:hypothetical protein